MLTVSIFVPDDDLVLNVESHREVEMRIQYPVSSVPITRKRLHRPWSESPDEGDTQDAVLSPASHLCSRGSTCFESESSAGLH